ncbi:ATP-binding protein [Motiliproteus sp. MSK22-1]|uniref:hybrid sensor histidine kinase/response regulator n=1 Tax=Motiliproteus sp. MSK22-1 TaxID=1897630 RepID=UPI00097750BC|nr:ATP-binding protein [Motiliproteus sp. MSK22-1]OMH32680.1 hypothetical protein BGP75_14145 [Motiliproteus sp. MSK22-1]
MKTIVVAEDSPTQALRLKHSLERFDYNCLVARDGMQALAFAKEHKPAAIVTDVLMPGLDGFQLCAAIKKDSTLKHIPVILLTSLTDSRHILQGLESHADFYFTKPCDATRLAEKIEYLLEIGSSETGQQEPESLSVTIFGETYHVASEPQQILNLFIATYENLMQQNEQLKGTERELKQVNGQLAENFEKLLASEDRFKVLVDTIPDIVYWTDAEGIFMFINSAINNLGYEPEELIGKHFSEIILESDVDRVSREKVLPQYLGRSVVGDEPPKLFDERRTGSRKTVGLEVRLISKPGSVASFGFKEGIAVVEVNSSGLYQDKPGKKSDLFIGTVGVIRDISERKRTERELIESNTRFRRAVIDAPYPVMIHAEDGAVIQLSKAWVELSGYTPEETRCIDEWITLTENPDSKDADGKEVSRTNIKSYYEGLFQLKTRTTGHEFVITTKKRDKRIWDFSSAPIGQLPDGRAIVISMAADITDRKQAELEILHAKNAAEANSKAKSDFLASMSHELRTPLNAIIGFSELLKESAVGELNPKQKEYITDIFDSGYHLLELINDVLDLAKVEAGKMELSVAPVIIADLVEQSLFMIREKCGQHGIQLQLDIDKNCRDIQLTVDQTKLKQVLFNLLSNATKFTPDGGNIRVCACLRSPENSSTEHDKEEFLLENSDGYIEIRVEDSGIGIAPEHQEKLFEEFYQVQGGLKNKTAGTGLGLPIARRFIQMHGGRLHVESEGEGKGSQFCIRLPLVVNNCEECIEI